MGGPDKKEAAAGLLGAQLVREMANENENSPRATAFINSLREAGKSYPVIARQLNGAGFKTPRGKLFDPTQVRRLHLRGIKEASTEVI